MTIPPSLVEKCLGVGKTKIKPVEQGACTIDVD